MPRLGTLALALAGLAALAPLARAHDSRALEASPPPAHFQLTIVEGSSWGEHRLYARLFPPTQGVPHRLPFMAGTSSPSGMAAFEVTPPKHTPRLRPPGWAELGKIPEDGSYSLRVSAGDAGERTFQLVLASGMATVMRPSPEVGSRVALPSARTSWKVRSPASPAETRSE